MQADLSLLTLDTREAYARLRGWSSATGYGKGFQVVSTRRSCEEQNGLYEQGRSEAGDVVTKAPGCKSWHVAGRAFDIQIAPGATCDAYLEMGQEWERMGGVWGGRWGDCVHFEWHPGISISKVCPDQSACPQVEKSGILLSKVSEVAMIGLATVGVWWFLRSRRLT